MISRVIAARYISGYTIWLRFNDGSEGTVDLSNELFGEVFKPLKAIDTFKTFSVNLELGTIVWPNGADFAPEFLQQILRSAA